MACPTSPPVHDSTVATRSPSAVQRPARRCARSLRLERPSASCSPVRSSVTAQRRWVFSGEAGGANSHVSGTPDLPSAPSDVPLSVKSVTPDDPVRTSTDRRPVKVRVLPFDTTCPAVPSVGSILPSTQTLIQAREPDLIETLSVTPWNATVTLRVSAAVLPSALLAVTVSAQRPAVSSSGALNAPSSPTGTLASAGVAGGAGVGWPGVPGGPDEPSHFAATTTDVAFVAFPAIGIAPFANEAPSAGWSTDSVGASTWRNGTVMNTCIVSSECLPVSGSTALMSNWLRPRRRSTAADHAPSDRAVTWYGSRPGVAIET